MQDRMETAMTPPLIAALTTIQPPTPAVHKLVQHLSGMGGLLIVAGDRKGPDAYPVANCEFLDLRAQQASGHELARHLPVGHYARKNIAYLQAMSKHAACIYETDDDNAPAVTWTRRNQTVEARFVTSSGWINAYRCFTDQQIWPRGFPLDAVSESLRNRPPLSPGAMAVTAPIQQGLANHSPDADAVWRLVLDRPFDFEPGLSIHLPPGAWCPFNSQSTWWWPEVYPLLYLPSHCSFRMTDIWRSFVAQRCLWELGYGVVIHGPEVVQERNPHDLMQDFNEEIPGYQRNRELVTVLMGLSLRNGAGNAGANLRDCYLALVAWEFFPPAELDLVDLWLRDLERVHQTLPC